MPTDNLVRKIKNLFFGYNYLLNSNFKGEEKKMEGLNLTQVNQYNFDGANFRTPVYNNAMDELLTDLFDKMSDMFKMFMGPSQGGHTPSCGCTSPPIIDDGSHPSGTLQTGDGKITTPGGYEIEPMSKFEWKITGPDGKSTRIWGDPHVAESDGGKWDFKRDSTFMLPDGTKINVTTVPWRDGSMTVTGGLEIINGNDRVLVSDIDKGKGNIGQVTADGFQHANSFGSKDVFVMGTESDDWSHAGREIIGSNNGGEEFKLGGKLEPGVSNTNWLNNSRDSMEQFLDDLMRLMTGGRLGEGDGSFNSVGDLRFDDIFGSRRDYADHSLNSRTEGFRMMSDMFDLLSRLSGLTDIMFNNRSRYMSV